MPDPNLSNPPPTAKCPGWPGDNVFRLIVPVLKVGGIIGRKGELVKRICDETEARIRVLEAPLGTPDRVVLITGQEDPDTPLSPAMDAVLRVFRLVADLPNIEADNALSLIGKQGSAIKSIQDSSGATVRVSAEDELPSYASSDERIVEIHGEALKFNATISQAHAPDAWTHSYESLDERALPRTLIGSEHPFSSRHDPFFDHEIDIDPKVLRHGLSHYSDDEPFSWLRPAGVSHPAASIITQV
ncbi:RNA-binding KH domain-containing protein [Drosera capensis]